MVVHYKDVGPIHIRGGDRLEKLLHQRHSGLQLHRLLKLLYVLIYCAPFEILTFTLA